MSSRGIPVYPEGCLPKDEFVFREGCCLDARFVQSLSRSAVAGGCDVCFLHSIRSGGTYTVAEDSGPEGVLLAAGRRDGDGYGHLVDAFYRDAGVPDADRAGLRSVDNGLFSADCDHYLRFRTACGNARCNEPDAAGDGRRADGPWRGGDALYGHGGASDE